MTGSDIPYQLRPNKFIDRQLFVDLLGRLISGNGNENYAYVSMGGKHLVDHNAIYRQLGIRQLYSFEQDENVVRRQQINKPIDEVLCRELDSAYLPVEIDTIQKSFSNAKHLIIWLDYTDPNARLIQLQEMIEVLKRLQPGDILRITLNASLGTLQKTPDEWRSEKFASPGAFWLEKLKRQLGELVPTDLTHIGDTDFPIALARCVRLAVSRAESELDDTQFAPELVTTYRDGQRMLTVTVRAKSSTSKETKTSNLSNWPFRAKHWRNIVWIEAPDFSMKEKMKIDAYLSRPPSYILERLKFRPASDYKKSLAAIKSYKQLHRYYPEFRNIEA